MKKLFLVLALLLCVTALFATSQKETEPAEQETTVAEAAQAEIFRTDLHVFATSGVRYLVYLPRSRLARRCGYARPLT